MATFGETDHSHSHEHQHSHDHADCDHGHGHTHSHSHSHTDGDGCEELSESSTEEYDQEPFSTFSSRLQTFLQTLIPNTTNITLHHFHGGLTNRIIGITATTTPEAAKDEELIIRIPRFGADNPDFPHHASTLKFLLNHETTLPIPAVIAFDAGTNNDINCAYLLQKQIPGTLLDEIYGSMTPAEKAQIVTQVVNIIAKMEKIEFPAIGRILENKSTGGIRLGPFPPFEEDEDSDYVAPKSTFAFLQYHFDARIKEAAGDEDILPLLEKLKFIARSVFAGREDEPAAISLYHEFFEPRTILVNVAPGDEQHNLLITGLLDMESTVALPREMARSAPEWLWTWPGLDEDDEDFEEVDLAVKGLFEEEIERAVPGYMDFWRREETGVERELIYFAMAGIETENDELRASEFFERMDGKGKGKGKAY